ncbi:MAG: PhoU domain-containing protein, partial [Deltaproteobacteria bacterium]|nr:PhoU domain-containing protein [Deltaproteobacteria bacterium]
MFSRIFKFLTEKTGLVSDARNDALNMLDHGRRMFDIVMQTLLKTPDVDILDQIKHLDQDINQVQRTVRRKVMEQLVFCRGQDIIDAVVLLTVVVDLERIGDYTKNIAELTDMMSKRCSLGKKEELVKDLHSRTVALFGTVRYAYER